MAQTVILTFLMTLTFTYVLLVVTQSRHEILESPYEVSMETCATCMIHSISAINVCTNFEINRYKFSVYEFRKHAKKSYFIWRHVTQTWYIIHHGARILLIGISIRNILKPTNQKSLRLPVKKWVSWFWWPWPLTLVLFFVTRTTHEVLESPCKVSYELVKY